MVSELIENPTARIPICLAIDTSSFMAGEIQKLNSGLNLLFRAIRNSEARWSVDVSIVAFGGRARPVLGFGSIDEQQAPRLSSEGAPFTGAGVHLALDLYELRERDYLRYGIDYCKPWLVLVAGGPPADSIEAAANRTCGLVRKGKLSVFPVAAGPGISLNALAGFSPERAPLRLRDFRFSEFFEWIGKNAALVSRSLPGERIQLDVRGIERWAQSMCKSRATEQKAGPHSPKHCADPLRLAGESAEEGGLSI